jgi:hypothetical protein
MITKWKAWLNVHGGREQHGINFWETYAPVVNLSTVRLVLTLSLLNGFKTRQVDFVQAFTQAPLDCPIYMEVPAGFSIIEDRLCFPGKATRNTSRTCMVSNRLVTIGIINSMMSLSLWAFIRVELTNAYSSEMTV